MKRYYTVPSLLLFFACNSRLVIAQISQPEKTRVDELIQKSRAFQWVDTHQSFDLADQAFSLANKFDYPKGIAVSANLRGFCFWTFGDNELAIQSAMEALDIGMRENDPTITAESYYILARSYLDLRELVKSNELIAKANRFASISGDWELISSIYNLRGVIKFVEGLPDSSLYYYLQAYELGNEHSIDPIHLPRIISNIGECYFDQDPTLGFTYFRRALSLAKETNNQIAEASITDIIGHAHLKTGNTDQAEKHLQLSLQLAGKLGLRRVVRHAYAGLVDIKLKQGMGAEAVKYLQKYYAVHDSLLNTSKVRQIVELEAKHTMRVKEQEMELLRRENQLRILWNNVLAGSIILLISLALGVYFLQRYRYRKNREMLNLEIDFLTQQHKETVDRFKASLQNEGNESLESFNQRLLRRAIAIVENHIADPQFGVEKLANEMHMSRTNLHRKIKSITGFPPNELIRSIRLRKAARLILHKVDSVTQVAQLSGFDDYSYFSKAFKKHFGVPPSNYVEHHNANRI